MRISLSRLRHLATFIIPFYCLLLVCCSFMNYKFIKAYEGPDLPANQFAKLYLDKGRLYRPDRNRPVSFVVDGKPYEYQGDNSPRNMGRGSNSLTRCLYILPGEHEVIIVGERGTFARDPIGEIKREPWVGYTEYYPVYPTPNQHIIKFKAEKGREYLVAEEYPNFANWEYMIFWIEDKITKIRITDKVLFNWK